MYVCMLCTSVAYQCRMWTCATSWNTCTYVWPLFCFVIESAVRITVDGRNMLTVEIPAFERLAERNSSCL
jgi:hypothetical protein